MARVIENPKQLILDKAKEILYKDGYSMLNMRNIAKACDIALGTIYNYYPTKKELIIDMMDGYWEEFFCILENCANSEVAFYGKLYKIYCELGAFIKNFKEIWLRPELYDTPDYVKDGLEREQHSIEKLIRKIESILIKAASKKQNGICAKVDTYETAKFIVMNFVTMIQMPLFQYSSFEGFLRKVLE